MFKKEELKLLWPFYVYPFLANVFGIGSLIWTVYFVQKGFSFTEFGIAMAALTAATLFFEVPTGAIADVFGRKTSVALGYLLFVLIPLSIPFVKSFWMLILIFVIMGIAMTLLSGAEEAWVVDHLKNQKRKELIQEYYIKLHSISASGILLAGLFLTGILLIFQSERSYLFLNRSFLGSDFVWFIQAAGMFLVLMIILLFTKEEFVRKKKKVRIQFFKVFHYSKKAASYIKNHSILSKLSIALFLLGFWQGIFGFAYQPLLIEFGFELKDFGWLRSFAAFFGIFLPFTAKFALKKYKPLKIIRWGFICDFIITLSVIFIAGPIAGLVYFLLMWDFSYVYRPIWATHLQKHIPSRLRATITSMQSMIVAVGAILSTLIAGPLIDSIGARKTVFLSAFVILPIIWVYFKIKR